MAKPGSMTARVKSVIFQEMMKNMMTTTRLKIADLSMMDTWVARAASIFWVSACRRETKVDG